MSIQLKVLFEEGRYEEALERSSASVSPMEAPWLMGAAVFLGDWERANSIYKKTSSLPEARSIGGYFQGLAALRRSDYALAHRHFKRNLKGPRCEPGSISEFFVHQGPAIFHYFRGDFAKARKWGERAFAAADEVGFLWGQVVSRDLLAHCYFHLGSVRMSQDYFQKAITQAVQLGNSALEAAMKISVLKYGAQAGVYGAAAAGLIEDALQDLDAHDTYSRIELLMELARQRSLAGRLGAAEEALNRALPLVHRYRNKRQIARLNFRLAYLQYLRGQDLPALSLLKAGATLLEPRIDHSILAEFAGLERHILAEDARFDSSLDTGSPPAANASYWSQRIHHRGEKRETSFPRGEDPLGDLLDLIDRDAKSAAEALLTAGYYGLLPKALGLKRGGRYLLLGVAAKGLVIVGEGNVLLKTEGMTNLLGKLLLSLSESRKTKRELIRTIWGYDYGALRHDPLLHRALTALRKLLSPVEEWITFDGESYGLGRDVKVRTFAEMIEGRSPEPLNTAEKPVQEPESGASSQRFDARLNHRQNLFLRTWPKHSPIDVREYADKFKVSIPSATRDLSGLLENGYVLRLGKARATRYIR